MNKWDIAVFDFDGTLADTIGGITDSVNALRKELNLSFYSEDEVKQFVGHGGLNLFLKAFSFQSLNETNKELYKHFLDIYDICQVNNVHLFPYVYNLLKFLNEKKIKIVIYSNKPTKILRNCADILFAGIEIQDIFGNDIGEKPKPDATFFKQYLQAHNLTSKEMVYIGDSPVDVQFANNMECDSIYCSYGYTLLDKAKKENPTYIVTSAKEINDIVSTNNKNSEK